MDKLEMVEISLRSKNYKRPGDRRIGSTKLAWYPNKRSFAGGFWIALVAYERPSTGEKFKIRRYGKR